MPKKQLKTRMNESGYLEFWDEDEQRWVLTHRRAAENKLKRALLPDEEVHHVNRDRTDNRHENLIVLKGNIHRHIHNGHPDACYRCGFEGHSRSGCYARRDVDGNWLT